MNGERFASKFYGSQRRRRRPGSKFEREPEEYSVGQLKRRLKCRVLKLSRKRDELLKRVSDCIKSGNHHTFDPSIDDGKWFSAKDLRENAKLQANWDHV